MMQGGMFSLESYEIAQWKLRMEEKFGVLRIGEHDWHETLFIERYGANPFHWPILPSEDDVKAAEAWEKGDLPDWIKKKLNGAQP